MEIVFKKLVDIKPYENNPRKNDASVDKVAASIKEFGFRVPIVIDGSGVIVAGHTRYKASKQLKLKEVPCVIADDLTEEQIKAYRLADNKTAEFALWDEELLSAEIDGIIEIDMTQFGFDLLSPDNFGDAFELPEGDKSEFTQMTFTFHTEQAEMIKYAMSLVEGEMDEANMFGNTNRNGNALYEVVRQWAEQRK